MKRSQMVIKRIISTFDRYFLKRNHKLQNTRPLCVFMHLPRNYTYVFFTLTEFSVEIYLQFNSVNHK